MELLTEKSKNVVKLYDENAGLWKIVRGDKGPSKSIEIIEGMLLKLGLSRNEVRVYLYLARSGEHKASDISESLSLHRTETYRILRDLEKRGLVSSVFEKPLKFIATPFEKAVDVLIEAKKLKIQLLEKKKKSLIDLWLSLPRTEVELERKEVFQILEGEEQIDLKANEIVDKAEEEICVFTSEVDLPRLYHSGFVDELERLSKKNATVKLLTNYSPKSCFFIEKMKVNDVRYALSGVEDLPSFILSDEKELLLLIRKNNDGFDDETRKKRSKIAALWTNYDAFVKTLRTLFLELWNNEIPLDATQMPVGKS